MAGFFTRKAIYIGPVQRNASGFPCQRCGPSIRQWYSGMLRRMLLANPGLSMEREEADEYCFAAADAMIEKAEKKDMDNRKKIARRLQEKLQK